VELSDLKLKPLVPMRRETPARTNTEETKVTWRIANSRVIASLVLLLTGAAQAADCPPDSVRVGTVCADKYEGSVWRIPPTNTELIKKVKAGKATLQGLVDGGATQAQPLPNCGGVVLDTSGFPRHGNWTSPFYAASVAGVYPTACISWFQAAQACALSGKRLLTNYEWQVAAAGTADPGENDGTTNASCNNGFPLSNVGSPRRTGAAGSTPGGSDSCISRWGAEDMVGNIDEWVSDWGERADHGKGFRFPADFAANDLDDESDFVKMGTEGNFCVGGPNANLPCTSNAECDGAKCGAISEPAAFQRGGSHSFGQYSGVFSLSVGGGARLWTQHPYFGFRCAR
jgi:formylglycine-generating enzyme required for sulfatase activity